MIDIVHGPTFQKQYDTHWLNPNETPVIWLGMVFSMMAIALYSFERNGEEPAEYRGQLQQMTRDYRRLTAQCLILSDITQPLTHMLETLLLFHVGEFARCKDADAGFLFGLSMIVRLAMRMGYHRDSKHYPAITPFAGEMRRRVWTVIRQADLLFSSQAGMPPMIRGHDANTEQPRNVYDDEIWEDMKALPPSRPMSETTPMCYVIYKAQLLEVFARILDVVQPMTSTSYEEVMKLDQQLREVQGNIPPLFKMRPVEESFRDPPALVMQRYMLDVLFLRIQIVLHRKFMCPSRDSGRYSYSRRTAIDAAMELLKYQTTLHNESRPGGRLHNVRWFVSSLTTHDFLLGAMIVSLDLYNTAEAERTGRRTSNDIYDWSQERRVAMVAALEQSLSIWAALREQSMEAFKATGVLTAIMGRLRAHEAQLRQQRAGQFGTFGANTFPTNGGNGDDANVAPEHSAAMTLGMLSTGALTPNTANMFAAMEANNTATSPQTGAPLSATTGSSSSGASGLTPNYMSGSSDQSVGNGPVNAPVAPFSSFFPAGMNLGFQNLDMPTGIDWVSRRRTMMATK
jgi:Fungal specific transcription factor domain